MISNHPTPTLASPELAEITLSQEHPMAKFCWYLYLPIGLVLGLVRVLLLLLVFAMTSIWKGIGNQLTNHAILAILGVRITYDRRPGELLKDLAGSIGAVNHVSVYDILIGLNLPNTTLLLAAPREKIPYLIIRKIIDHMPGTSWDLYDKRQLVRNFQAWTQTRSSHPIFVVPEKTINNGKGLFAFQSDFLHKAPQVVPLALRIWIPFGLHPHASYLSYAGRLLRLLALPIVHLSATALPPRKQQVGQSNEAFARQIQEDIAAYLGIPATRWTHVDKRMFMQRRRVP
ncbi:MAG: hypothetical protein AAF804_07370 [Bacteroidota bacterium]